MYLHVSYTFSTCQRKRSRSPDERDRSRERGRDEGKTSAADGEAKRVFTKSQAETKFGYGLWKGENASCERAAGLKTYEPGAPRVQKKDEYTFTGRKGILDNGAEAARKHHAQRPKMTDDERQAALAAMMGNAAAHDSHRAERSVCLHSHRQHHCRCRHSALRDRRPEPEVAAVA